MDEEFKIQMLYEHNLDIDAREIYLFKTIDEDSALEIIKNIKYLDKTEGPITLVLASDGGNIEKGLAIIDAIQSSQNVIRGYVPGNIASMAVDILQACDVREMTANSSLMVHAGYDEIEGDITSVINRAKSLEISTEMALDFYLKRVKLTREELRKLMAADTVIYAKDALKYGFVDKIKE